MSFEDIFAKLDEYGCNLVEVTGGEPLAQKNVFPFITKLCDRGYEVLIETSGSISIAPVDQRAKVILDLKCPGSGEVEKNLWSNIAELDPGDEVKFVIADRIDYDWARAVIAKHQLDRFTILFSPVWGEMNMKDLAEWMLADHVPARFQTQLHKHIWGADVHGV